MPTSDDIKEREKFAKDEMCKDLKRGYDLAGVQKTGEQIEREVQKMQEDIFRRRDHKIYKGK